jgi:hypothetical protein
MACDYAVELRKAMGNGEFLFVHALVTGNTPDSSHESKLLAYLRLSRDDLRQSVDPSFR